LTGGNDTISDLKIVHAEEAFFDYDPRDARKILRVKTKLALNPATPGFDANARHDMLQDIGKKFRGPNPDRAADLRDFDPLSSL
jgi:hypothetical protein